MASAIVAGHGSFAAGMTSAVIRITGNSDSLLPFSNNELSKEAIEAELLDLIEKNSIRVIFTDLPSGSITIAARRIQRNIPDLKIVTGANLPLLIDFVLSADVINSKQEGGVGTIGDIIAHSVDRGRSGLMLIQGK